MRTVLAGLAATMVLASAGAAHATIVFGTFSGTVIRGYAKGIFGVADRTDLTDKAITGTFRYDTDLLGSNCASGTSTFGCFLGTGMTITQTINEVTAVFDGTPSPSPQLFNIAESGLLFHNFLSDAVNLHTLSMIGDPVTVFNQYETALSFSLTQGAIADATNPVLEYEGPAGNVGVNSVVGGQIFTSNHAAMIQLTGGFVTQQADYDFSVDHYTSSAAPEPGTWALLIVGFGLAGAQIRRRRSPAAA